MARHVTLGRLADLTEDQWGLVTRRQVERAGVSRATVQRLVASGVLRRRTHGTYQLSGAPEPDLVDLRAAWLQLAPDRPAWEREAAQGVVSHRSAAAVRGLGELPADRHEFTLPGRRQSRRPDLRLHTRPLADGDWTLVRGLPVTTPARTVADLIEDREDLGAVAQVVADALRSGERRATLTPALGRYAARLGLPAGDGDAVLRHLLELAGSPDA
jgi:hypothetical protein